MSCSTVSLFSTMRCCAGVVCIDTPVVLFYVRVVRVCYFMGLMPEIETYNLISTQIESVDTGPVASFVIVLHTGPTPADRRREMQRDLFCDCGHRTSHASFHINNVE